MNAVFSIVLIVSLIYSLIFSPESFLNSITSASQKTVELTISLVSVYAVFMGINELLNATKISKKLAKLFEKPVKKLFGCSVTSGEVISLNLIANALGLSGVATPLGIKAMKSLEEENNERAKTLLAVISSTSIQLFPLSVIQLYTLHGGSSVGAVIIVSIISTTISTGLGILFAKVIK